MGLISDIIAQVDIMISEILLQGVPEGAHAPHIAVIDSNRLERAFLRNFIRTYFNDIPVRTYKDGPYFAVSAMSMKDGMIRAVFIDPGDTEEKIAQSFAAIRNVSALNNIPVFIMGRKTRQDMLRSLFDSIIGADVALDERFIIKPFDRMQLSQAIKRGDIRPAPSREGSAAA